MTFTLYIINDAPYGNERAYNAPRLAGVLAARVLRDEQLVEGAKRGTLAQLADWTAEADKVRVF
jgi:sulfur relay (sulfurtransferase) complex TusBCD TusD component (DsrE family)